MALRSTFGNFMTVPRPDGSAELQVLESFLEDGVHPRAAEIARRINASGLDAAIQRHMSAESPLLALLEATDAEIGDGCAPWRSEGTDGP
jgi:hypothetical protein